MSMKYTQIICIALAALFITITPASAHLAGGADVVVGNYLIDVSWDQEQWQVGKLLFVAVNLVDNTTHEPVPFTSAFMRLDADAATEFSVKTVQDLPGHAAVQFTPAIAGAHQLRIALYNESTLVAETTIPITVVGEETGTSSSNQVLWFGLGVIVAVGAGLGWQRFRTK
jgi:hypothetical protein